MNNNITVKTNSYDRDDLLNTDCKIDLSKKAEPLDEKLEIIKGRYFFLTPDITLSEEEYSELRNRLYNDDNVTYFVCRDVDGNLMVY